MQRICNGGSSESSRVSPVARVVDLDLEKTRRLARDIERELRNSGGREFAVEVGAVEDVSRWRRAAIMAAHRMGHRASTYLWRGKWRIALEETFKRFPEWSVNLEEAVPLYTSTVRGYTKLPISV